MNCKNTRSCCSPYSVLAQQLEETTERAIQAYNLAAAALTNPVEGLTVDGDLQVNGDILQNGSAYETHAEKVYTNDDYIVMRDGAVSALGAGDYSGFQVKKYDGTNDGRLVIDRDGTARVGDVGDEQPLATRDESADLTDGHLVKWDATNLKLIDAGVDANSVGMEFLAKGNVNVYVGTPYNMQSVTINLPSPAEFTSDYDYMVTANVLNADDYSVMDDVTISLPNNTVTTPGTSFNIGIVTGDDVVVFWYVYRMKKNHTGLPNLFGCFPSSLETQPKLVSGTNIKTVGGQSLLGSGDVPAGGLTWTKRTANDNWTDMFIYESGKMKILKHVYIFDPSGKFSPVYLPKGYESSSVAINIGVSSNKWVSNNVINVGTYFTIHNNNLTAMTLTEYYIPYTFTTDGSNITITKGSSSNTPSVLKSTLVIYTAD